MLPFKLIYSDAYYLPIGEHVSLPRNIGRVRERLLKTGVAEENDFLEPQPATDDDILLVHTPEYVDKLATGTLNAREELALEVPYSRDLVDAFWLAAGDRCWRQGTRSPIASRSTLVADFIMPSPITAKASA